LSSYFDECKTPKLIRPLPRFSGTVFPVLAQTLNISSGLVLISSDKNSASLFLFLAVFESIGMLKNMFSLTVGLLTGLHDLRAPAHSTVAYA